MKVYIGPYTSFSEREIDIEIHDYDSWNCDDTLNPIIHKLLKQLRNTTNSYPVIPIENLPKGAQERIPQEIKEDSSKIYEWILDEILWATNPLEEEPYSTQSNEYYWNRRKDAMEMFGKFYYSFWD